MSRKKRSIPDKTSEGRSDAVPFDPYEDFKERHARRLGVNVTNKDLMLEFCKDHKIDFAVKNNEHHWMFIFDKKLWVEWWPSTAKLVINKQWNKGRHVHDIFQVMLILKRTFDLRDGQMYKQKFDEMHKCGIDHDKFRELAEWWLQGGTDSAKITVEMARTETNVQSSDILTHLLSELGHHSLPLIIERFKTAVEMKTDEVEILLKSLEYNEFTELYTDELKPIINKYLDDIYPNSDVLLNAIVAAGQLYPDVALELLGMLFVGDKEIYEVLENTISEIEWKMRHE